jgi:hypothetical protein
METTLRQAVRLERRAMTGGDAGANRSARTSVNHHAKPRPQTSPFALVA